MRAMPFLMFQGQAEEAMRFYVSLFPDGAVESLERYGASGPGAPGTLHQARFTVAGQRVMCIDSPTPHGFGFTPSVSFFVDCDDEAQLARLAQALAEQGATLMPLDNYGFSRKFTWVQDRFGVSWQLNLP
ncbi:VOC family protein [Bordetella hinzii]|jgi:predicted 3-demethylubiquinone-9 3-methyltransferase (glyoxalase superfamily)|uniref:PhnB-like domain-containing protein n=1 Tax=Bordetella hinzii TaxID=103855 RepID=A0AAN1RYR6_9BORD|nr:VOC family protein [Bordetella hinzii]AKQ60334.1 3-demethylubiquinone-9 3-methyltransferase [Bordetella hinzii]AZW18601.1 hypothetical protein CS347_18460 [Bordetella hinzii]KCB45929.1 3-demethylubiquinone-9 3-methyltransferase domain protein [Bordetella hinzii 4161]QET42787.1 VOC family protein [Bordetella hinzii]WPL80803.1 VOC family protein [Bordetella hinzii]